MADINNLLKDVQKTAAAPQKTAAAPQKTAVQKTAAIEKTAAAPATEGGAPQDGPQRQYEPGAALQIGQHSLTVKKVIGTGSEGVLYLVTDGRRDYALKLCNPGFRTNMALMPAIKGLPKGYVAELVDYGE